MKKLLKALIVILILILIKLVITYTINLIIIYNYNKNIYRKDLIEVLKDININEPYIVYYNEGNIFYKEKKYDEAIKDYKKALKKTNNRQKKCDIRINMTLSMMEKIDKNNKQELLKELKKARENLYKDHCADEENDSGESQEAEELEEEIKEQETKAQENENEEQQPQQQEEQQNEEENESEEEKNIREQLQEINKGANESRQGELDEYKNLGKSDYYSGKKW